MSKEELRSSSLSMMEIEDSESSSLMSGPGQMSVRGWTAFRSRLRPSPGHLRCHLYSILSVSVALVLILIVVMLVRLGKEDRKLWDLERAVENLSSSFKAPPVSESRSGAEVALENLVANLTSLLISLSSKTQEEGKHARHRDLAELKIAVDSVNVSLTSLSSRLQETATMDEKRSTQWQATVTNLTSSLALLTSGLKERDAQSAELIQIRDAVTNLTSLIHTLSSKPQERGTSPQTPATRVQTHSEPSPTPPSPAKAGLRCHGYWFLHSSSCYLFSSSTLSWQQAADSCRSQGAMLLALGDNSEWRFVTSNSIPGMFWVSLTANATGQWRWVDGTPCIINKSTSHWYASSSEQWRIDSSASGRSCSLLRDDGKLNTDHCSRRNRYICERPATPA
ncbi:C-type lectin domain family 4 member F-like [Denticeps clupeoides]|uniref:C-type lectin domain-containing protein n=1 Tax=Denticeps clupeoides TaxID=299321 RepID=A0AAY4EMG0_9TELE|nr:C-type lectin domain family 4 member F-like [Denticeps clupeoides]